jgi:peptidoglycan/xylan/chitin deacetylase (PgdA/CDA1 family)
LAIIHTFGQLSPEVAKMIRSEGMRIVLWDANSGDSWLKTPQQVIQMSLYESSLGGNILLMHSKPTTAKALDALLTELQKRGFRFVLPSVD